MTKTVAYWFVKAAAKQQLPHPTSPDLIPKVKKPHKKKFGKAVTGYAPITPGQTYE